MGAGRPAKGPEMVEEVEGSKAAKQRARAVLEVIAGRKEVGAACADLGIKESRFEEIRFQAIRGLVESLEPKAAGRPPLEKPEENPPAEELRKENLELKKALLVSQTREELALVFPKLVRPTIEEGKKKRR